MSQNAPASILPPELTKVKSDGLLLKLQLTNQLIDHLKIEFKGIDLKIYIYESSTLKNILSKIKTCLENAKSEDLLQDEDFILPIIKALVPSLTEENLQHLSWNIANLVGNKLVKIVKKKTMYRRTKHKLLKLVKKN